MTGTPASSVLFPRVAFIGIGLIGSSLARAMRQHGLVGTIACHTSSDGSMERAKQLGVVDEVYRSAAEAVRGADLVVLAVPIGANAACAEAMASGLKPGAIVTDVGSVKQSVIRDVSPFLPDSVAFVPGHPLAGTEHSGPDAGFAELFISRWCILTPPPGTPEAAVARVRALWEAVGSKVDVMEPGHHDRVLAITSHLPHLIAYTIVGTADDLASDAKQEVIKYSASGFRDFTRIAASDPTMWRDIFLNNREAVLEIVQRFTEDLTALQRAIRWGEGDALFDLFTRTRAIRRGIIDQGQAYGSGIAPPPVPEKVE
ncbi:prephenate/arogenate dehydrogenase family protein [Insolitispirillum peregrinum]|uniref:prephenate/arogenate dehydrogenase family protein n=1 Tax=Insolitispirillum peregrinum TaxID=80876 RepID=UPI003614962A